MQLKQEFLQRTVKDIQEKSEELKTTGREILNLRKDLNALKQENVRLKHALHTEDVIEAEAERRKGEVEYDKMPTNELKNKLYKLAQAYRADLLRNKELE